MDFFKKIEHEILPFIEKPSRYIGLEFSKYLKKTDEKQVKICLIFPDLYEIGMSSLGIKLLFHYLNRFDEILVDMAFMPKKDFLNKLRENNLPLFSLGYKKPLNEFDILGFSLTYELCYTNVLAILDYARIPVFVTDRNETCPIIIAGGCASSNPDPVASFIDVFVVGDGEEISLEICKLVRELKNKNSVRDEILQKLAKSEHVYVPRFYDGKHKIKPSKIKNLDENYFPTEVIRPFVNIVHEHLSVEIQRGCYRLCKFCSASFTNLPLRTRSLEKIKNIIETSLQNNGVLDVSLLSLSVIDHPEIEKILKWFIENYYDKKFSISLPSLRCDRFSSKLADLVSKNKKSSLTFAPEAGSQRLRDFIGKNVSREDIFDAIDGAYQKGWRLVKLYFMYGLPSETKEDLEELVELVKSIKKKFKNLKLNVGISSFVPKAHTPFAWEKQEDLESLLAKKRFLIDNLKNVAQVKHSKLESSVIEGLLSRGDENVSKIIFKAWENGAIFDQWDEFFDYEIWRNASSFAGIDLEKYVSREINFDDINGWEKINFGISRDALKRMSRKIYFSTKKNFQGDIKDLTNDEKICDLRKNFAENTTREILGENEICASLDTVENEGKSENKRYRIFYEKNENLRFLSHLELAEAIKNFLINSGLNLAFSEGFHPLPKVSFGPPLSVGFVGENECFDVELTENFDSQFVKDILNAKIGDLLKIKEVVKIQKNSVSIEKLFKLLEYEVELPEGFAWEKKIYQKFIKTDEFFSDDVCRDKNKIVDLKKAIYSIEIKNSRRLNLIINTNEAFINLYAFLHKVFGIDEDVFKKSLVSRKNFWIGNGFGAILPFLE